jgi:hypothetical protein
VHEDRQEPRKGPSRFRGIWGLKRWAKAVEVTLWDAMMAARVMRRSTRAQEVTQVVSVKRYEDGACAERSTPRYSARQALSWLASTTEPFSS